MPVEETAERWAGGAAYEGFIGRWSRLVAEEFVAWLAVPPSGHWLDVGCGTGALSQAILAHAAPATVQGIDSSAAYIAHVRAAVHDPRATFTIADARELPGAARQYDAAVSGLALNFVPAVGRAVAEMARVVRPGGTVAAYVWDYAEGMQLLRHFWSAATALDQTARNLDEGERFPLCQPGPLATLFRNAGLRAVEVRPIEIATRFRDFDDLWIPFLGSQGPAPGYVATLDERHRTALRKHLRDKLPIAADGSIALIARAWAVRGQCPDAGHAE